MTTKERRDVTEKGIVSREVFEALHADAKEEAGSRLTSDQTWEFLKKLNLATEMKSNEKPRLYIPSLIPEKNEKVIKNAFDDIRKSKNSLGFHLSLQKSERVTDVYSKLLCRLASEEFFFKEKNPGIRFDVSFASRIENRRLGLVAGTKGSLIWEDKGNSKITVNFLITEFDCDNTNKELKFARNKVTFRLFIGTLTMSAPEKKLHFPTV